MSDPVAIAGWPVTIHAIPTDGYRYEVRIGHGLAIATIAAPTIGEAGRLVAAALADAEERDAACLQSQVELALRRAGLTSRPR